tara:strand:- start:400 stop:1695 length:1296 start_codon:yes stop_codon:yes gene_type:complete
MRKVSFFDIKNKNIFIKKLIFWLDNYKVFLFLNSNGNSKKKYHGEYDIIAGVDPVSFIRSNKKSFKNLRDYYCSKNDWIMGNVAYDLKNETEKLSSKNTGIIKFDNIYFFQPRLLFIVKSSKLEIHHFKDENVDFVFEDIMKTEFKIHNSKSKIVLKKRDTKKKYLEKIKYIQDHIKKGDIYELNYCQEFYSEGKVINPIMTYLLLNQKSLTPFSCLFKHNKRYLISSSPERYIKGDRNNVISQPIKGTSKRYFDKTKDNISKNNLIKSKKEISENIMTVDLVRNDLGIIAKRGSVKVSELCGIYTFKQVHQLVSTIKCKLEDNKDWIDVLNFTFPMGSMTGTPKIKSMQLIDKFESFKRGMFSGSVGYVSPNSEFDFNVIIRAIIYDDFNKYISVPVGGAITFNSIPEKEYNECLIKAKAMFNSLFMVEK